MRRRGPAPAFADWRGGCHRWRVLPLIPRSGCVSAVSRACPRALRSLKRSRAHDLAAAGSRPYASARRRRSPGPPSRHRVGDVSKDALLAEIRKQKLVFYNTVVAQAQKIEVDGDRDRLHLRAVSTHTPRRCSNRIGRGSRSIAQQARGAADHRWCRCRPKRAAPVVGRCRRWTRVRRPSTAKPALREQALADAGVQALLEVFPAEIRDVEEM